MEASKTRYLEYVLTDPGLINIFNEIEKARKSIEPLIDAFANKYGSFSGDYALKPVTPYKDRVFCLAFDDCPEGWVEDDQPGFYSPHLESDFCRDARDEMLRLPLIPNSYELEEKLGVRQKIDYAASFSIQEYKGTYSVEVPYQEGESLSIPAGCVSKKNYELNQNKCEFCFTEIHPEATVCPSCNAVKSYGLYNSGLPLQKKGLYGYLVLLLFVSILHLLGTLYIALVFALFPLWKLYRGPKWYRR
ncbi:hypothetical protein WH95_19855 [Kiloniella litopenaei]|uniref:Uncharacterized protein n=1 Tax=Kiloniella litopenaei TaxID=1549748 RepID=A0A0M2R0N5_9PROT|nr:hypothetical protein [Kiloniella litopenaei]KKJ75176.1 hypothetical protein WH95_19855 [Kiloniella litopenaei]